MSRREKPKALRPAETLEGRENQLIALATDLAARQLQDGSASAQVITHFLKLGSTREQLEHEKLMHENLLLSAKRGQIQSAQRLERLYEDAMRAMKGYQGVDINEGDEYDNMDEYDDDY